MRVCWIVSENYIDPKTTTDQLHSIGPLWGSWRTWRSWNTDNVICDDVQKVKELVQRDFQKNCNLYIPNKTFGDAGRSPEVKLYEGNFPGELDRPEEIIAMHLAASGYDLVLLLGFELSDSDILDKFQLHKRTNYINAFRATLNTYPDVQWVLIDHPNPITKKITLPNLTADSLDSVMGLLASD